MTNGNFSIHLRVLQLPERVLYFERFLYGKKNPYDLRIQIMILPTLTISPRYSLSQRCLGPLSEQNSPKQPS